MASRTQIVCLHEGTKGKSIDPVFINRLIRSLNPKWIRPSGTNFIRLVPKGGRKAMVEEMPNEVRMCWNQGGHTTLMVWADLDDDMPDGDALKTEFWKKAQAEGISEQQFEQVVFIFAKDRLENWIQFIRDGSTDEGTEGSRVKDNSIVAEAAKSLAKMCQKNQPVPQIPPSLDWSCKNWRKLVDRMKNS